MVGGLCEGVLAKTHQSQAEAEAPLAIGDPLKVHFGSKEQFVKRVGIKQPSARRHLYDILLAEDRALLGGKGAVRAFELLQQASHRPEVEETHTLITQVKERTPRRLRE